MEIYKLATRKQLRFPTPKGSLSLEQLWTLELPELDALAVSYETAEQQSGTKSFLTKSSVKNMEAKLRFDVTLDILNTKLGEANKAAEIKANKEHNNKILTLIANKKNAELEDKSVEELEALIIK